MTENLAAKIKQRLMTMSDKEVITSLTKEERLEVGAAITSMRLNKILENAINKLK